MKKPNAIAVNAASRKWLYPNEGHFVVTRRFSSKEEKRRVVASVCPPELPGKLIGFENHLNVYHANRRGLPELLAVGLGVYLNSSLVDRYFRQFSGHTQVQCHGPQVPLLSGAGSPGAPRKKGARSPALPAGNRPSHGTREHPNDPQGEANTGTGTNRPGAPNREGAGNAARTAE